MAAARIDIDDLSILITFPDGTRCLTSGLTREAILLCIAAYDTGNLEIIDRCTRPENRKPKANLPVAQHARFKDGD